MPSYKVTVRATAEVLDTDDIAEVRNVLNIRANSRKHATTKALDVMMTWPILADVMENRIVRKTANVDGVEVER